ncbi:hypothetical protein BJF89_02070 [Corynebacterium sp. CNJ-954]|uniref:hypothetical protein n=1 Tax=Corynebacterium sp. CNJ-954 TaxID=1904962 RepID=UPI0009690D88|nr:hypothetical protein [Corynebacterium sp. CNJ-954]OLT53640.1 hypothetical protein BJF89_02070 [Corynebacterium sp. CNJ-954]
MSIDLTLASQFMTSHARTLDRHRFEILTTGSGHDAVVRALGAYRNDDGGYGWGLEPDLRAPESQPAGALHALEALVSAAPALSPHTVDLLDWLESVTLPDGGLPFALPLADPTACSPFWVNADPMVSSLQITAAVAAQAHLLAHSDDRVRDHPWLSTATQYCINAIHDLNKLQDPPFAYVLSFALQLLDATGDASDQIRTLGRFVPSDGAVPVTGGAEGETLRLLDISPFPDQPVRELLDTAALEDDLDRLERSQCTDGGWPVDFTSYSPAASLEWRGHATVRAVEVLRANGH